MTYILTIPTTSIPAGRTSTCGGSHRPCHRHATAGERRLVVRHHHLIVVWMLPRLSTEAATPNEDPSPDLYNELVAAGYGDWITTVTEFLFRFLLRLVRHEGGTMITVPQLNLQLPVEPSCRDRG